MPLDEDDARRDPTVLESAMDTGSELGAPGDRSDEAPLTTDEQATLERLVDDTRPDVVTDAPEDSDAEARAVADDTVLPDAAEPAGSPDPETPRFHAAG